MGCCDQGPAHDRPESQDQARRLAIAVAVGDAWAAANDAATIEEALTGCLDKVAAQAGWISGRLYIPGLPDADGGSGCVARWTAEGWASRCQVAENGPAAVTPAWDPVPGAGRCQEACRRPDAERVTGTLVFPVLAGQEMVGVLELCTTSAAPPREDEVASLAGVARALGRVVERLEMVERLRRSDQELRSMARLKDALVAAANHELRSPLNTVTMALEIVNGGDVGAVSQEAYHVLGLARAAAERLTGIVDDVFDLLAIAREDGVPAPRPCPTADAIRWAEAAVAPLAVEAGVRLHVRAAPAMVRADPDRLARLLATLLGDAVANSPRGGVVRLSARETGGEIVFRIAISRPPGSALPTGPAGSNRRRACESGHGLALCRAIVKGDGGRLWFKTTRQRGTSIQVAFPKPDAELAGDGHANLNSVS